MSITIRKAKIGDFAEIVELFKQLWPGKNMSFGRVLNVFDRMLQSDAYELVCVEKSREIIGFASLVILHSLWQEGLIMHVSTMIVDEKRRGEGIGKTLMNYISDIAKQKGCAKIELESAFHRSDAHGFYEKMGFEKRAYFFSKDVQ